MDQFYHTLRKIQKKERSTGKLARVDETFYHDIHKYINDLKKSAGEDLFAAEYTLIKDTQRVATEICERREHKITDAAVVNIHRSYHLFTGKPKFDLIDTTPLNLTPEEEKFYFSLIDTLKNHRGNISLDKIAIDQDSNNKKSSKTKSQTNNENHEIKSEGHIDSEDLTLQRLNQISKANIITDEKVEPIEKQIIDSKKSKVENKVVKPIEELKSSSNRNIENIEVLLNEKEEFVDLESRKLSKESELVKLLIFEEIGAIVGVDEKVYGPFYPQDIIVMPKINAMIFVKNRKGRIIKI